MEEAFYESPVLRRFAGVDLGRAAAPDETTILRFRHLLEEHDLGGETLVTVNQYLEARGIRITTGTIVDATIIHAPSSTKNSSGEQGRSVSGGGKSDVNTSSLQNQEPTQRLPRVSDDENKRAHCSAATLALKRGPNRSKQLFVSCMAGSGLISRQVPGIQGPTLFLPNLPSALERSFFTS
jgi:IS5 family transposase